jgi:hypothetical protein
MIQPHLLTRLIKNFGEEIEEKRKLLIPGTPRFKIKRSTVNMDVLARTISMEIQIQSQHVILFNKIFSTRHH